MKNSEINNQKDLALFLINKKASESFWSLILDKEIDKSNKTILNQLANLNEITRLVNEIRNNF